MKLLTTLMLLVLPLLLQAQNKVTVKIHNFKNYEGYEQFATEACHRLEKVFNSDKFKQAVLKRKFTKTNGLTNQQIYETIMKAHEVQGDGGMDNCVDLRVRIITLEEDGSRWINNCKLDSHAGTIGIDGKGDGVTAICLERLKLWSGSNDYAQLAAHYAHEYMHIIGFSHKGLRKNRSLVYQVGNIVEELIKQDLQSS